jgi:long-chain acyl-CoA synthetase
MNLSLSNLLFDRSERDPERTAILTPEGTISYGQVAREAAGLARLLQERGLGRSRISILLPNIPRFASIFHGILGAGGSAVMSNPVNSPREVEEQLLDAGVAAVFTSDALRKLLPPGARALVVDELPAGVREIHQGREQWWPLPATEGRPDLARGGSDEAAILFTAAERGRARGAVLTHRNLIANLRSTMEMMRMDEHDRIVAALPQVHAFGLTVALNAAIAAGATVVPVERFHPVRTLELIATTRATVFAGVPAMFMGIMAVLEHHPLPSHALRITLSGGAPIHPAVQAQWEERFGIPLRQGYGLTEASPVCLFNSPDRPNRPGTLGVPIPRVEVSIQNGAGGALAPGEVGEICVRGENVFPGFLDAGDEPQPFRDGWLRTGDLGRVDTDGYVRFVGILKPMFTRSGFNVYPREVERVVAEDPRVARASVHAQPDPARENEIVLVVEAASGHALTEEEVKEICKARLASYKQPGKILIV